MVLGYTFLYLALAATAAASLLFTQGRREGQAHLLDWARKAAVAAAGGVIAAAGYLMFLIATHQFQVSYVAEYSAKRSSSWFLFAAFWGGQEGSLLLWAFWTAILGALLAYRSGNRAGKVWPIFGMVQVFLLGLILVKCPFALGAGPVPADGKGLNPLLENYWMVIHPPILFLGFASTLFPWVWAMYGLIYRDWDGWIKPAFAWTLFSFAALGLGLSMGGYWAYETLGWGGFWAWDPVENSSLVPWLFLTALLHGIPIQRSNGGFKVTNLLIAPLTFATMFYGTFLTRSGLLTDFSVHSFSSLGKDGFYILLAGVLAAFFVPLGLLLWRLRGIPKPAAYEKVVSREFGYSIGSAILGVIGLIVAVGMSAPLITKLWTEKGAAAQAQFYNTANYPLVLILTLGMAATPYLSWRGGGNTAASLKRLFPAYAFAIVLTLGMTGAAMSLGVRQPWMLLMFATSVFAVFSNLILLVPRLPKRESRRTVGGFVAHIGAGMVLMGVATLVAFTRSAERVLLVKNVPQQKLGYTMTYLGQTTQPYDRENNALRIQVVKNGRMWEANPRYYVAPWENKDTIFANPPAIGRFGWGDFYVAYSGGPIGLDPKEVKQTGINPNNGFTVKAEQNVQAGEYLFTLLGLDLDDRAKKTLAEQHNPKAMMDLPEVTFKAVVGVTYRGQTAIAEPLFRYDQKTGGRYSIPVPIPGGWDKSPTMLKFVPPTPEEMNTPEAFDKINLQTLNAPDPTEAVMVDVSTKPMVWLIWLGTLLYTAGGFIAYRRRARENGLLGDNAGSEAKADPSAA
ncbi:MAG: cytochrome c biogenesis protein CcsA [Cytophagales bacterium]|nr:cytochrome c biogenesis protein CcsA [Armatimonadota bacterium]